MEKLEKLQFVLPEHWQKTLNLPLITSLPPAQGRRLPNGMLIIDNPDLGENLYKFSPWASSQLALNEMDIYARLYAEGIDTADIVQLKAVGATEQYLVRQMERSPLGSLDRFLLDKGELSEQQISWLLIPVVQALAQLHAVNLLHRDLKAENILVFGQVDNLASTQLKLSDFDRTIYLAKDEYLEKPVGSLLHMAPELIAWQAYNHKVDVYAFAMLLFELAHQGRQPYANIGTGMPDSITRKEFAEQVVNEHRRPIWQHRSQALKSLAEDCWQTEPAQRPEFNEVLQRLKLLAGKITTAIKPVISVKKVETNNPGIACHIGKVRRQMEDAGVVLQVGNTKIAAIFDGLRDNRSSTFAAHQLPLLLVDKLLQGDDSIETILQDSFSQVDNTLKVLQPSIESGTTATLALLQDNQLWLAWLGDSPAWLLRGQQECGQLNEIIELTYAHHPDREGEAVCITEFGGRVGREVIWLDNGEQMPSGPARVYYPADNKTTGIALSRALGLFSFKPAISSKIDILYRSLQAADNFLLLASDGVLPMLDKQTVLRLINMSDSIQQAAELLIEEVLKRGAPDNASVIVLNLQVKF